jgi:hypothetical protein
VLVISNDQLLIFGRYRVQEFIARMALEMTAAFPIETELLSGPALDGMILAAIEQSRLYGITLEVDVQRYVEYLFAFRADFDTIDWAGCILRDDRLTGTQKMDSIDSYVVSALTDGCQ